MRTFLALDLPDSFREELSNLIDDLRSYTKHEVNWVAPQNLHITFQFIGNTKPEDIPEITQSASELFSSLFQADSLKSYLKDLSFSNPKLEIHPQNRPRIIWISLISEDRKIFTINSKLKQMLISKGYKLDSKPLKLHITLGRVKKRLPEILIQRILTTELIRKSLTVEQATLYQSVLQPTGPVYTALAEFSFKNKE